MSKRKCKRCLKWFEEKEMHGRYCNKCRKSVYKKEVKNDN
tara:strand:+ start:6879 stop:6998 length:120 start_codon:yes stop_codon:yes gene_type:complete